MSNIVDIKERMRRKTGDAELDFTMVAEFVRFAAEDIVWLARLSESYGPARDNFRHNLGKRQITAEIGQHLQRLQSEFACLERLAEQEEPGAAS